MKKKYQINTRIMVLGTIVIIALSSCSPKKADTVELTILAATSLMDVCVELIGEYKEIKPEVTLTVAYGSSGALQTQIEEGAPADVFLSAGKKQVDALSEKELLLDNSRIDLLVNKIVLITSLESSLELKSFEDVAGEDVKMIALGEPEGVPLGQYTNEVFTNLGIIDIVKTKSNYGSDVKQVLTWVETGEVECGVVYATDAAISEKVKIQCEAPEGSHKPIIYPGAVLKDTQYPTEAKAFLEFLSSEDAKRIFEKFGFKINE